MEAEAEAGEEAAIDELNDEVNRSIEGAMKGAFFLTSENYQFSQGQRCVARYSHLDG